MEPEQGQTITDGTYVRSTIGRGIYYVKTFLIKERRNNFLTRLERI